MDTNNLTCPGGRYEPSSPVKLKYSVQINKVKQVKQQDLDSEMASQLRVVPALALRNLVLVGGIGGIQQLKSQTY